MEYTIFSRYRHELNFAKLKIPSRSSLLFSSLEKPIASNPTAGRFRRGLPLCVWLFLHVNRDVLASLVLFGTANPRALL